jgi:DNA repair photolyase
VPLTGRGARTNPPNRCSREGREPCDDGWWRDDELPPLRTTVTDEAARTIIASNSSPDIPFARSVNPYRGCEHGCIYCYARPSHAYLGLSAGLDFETRLFAKPNAAALLGRAFATKGYRPQPIMLGANTDPYQPVERDRKITRALLEVFWAFRHPLAITTKSALVVRDAEILGRLAGERLVSVAISITTLDPELARRMEPRASTPRRRLEALRRLSAHGIPTRILAAPMIPALNDHELERILAAAATAGARAAGYSLLRLPLELKELFTDWLAAHAPERATRVLGRLRACRDGMLYVSDFASRMTGTGREAALLAQRFRLACRRLGLRTGEAALAELDHSRFAVPAVPGAQLALL